jgi:cell division septation protein DedD
MAHDVFISHSAQDKTVADAVRDGLELAGLRCWMAHRDALPGQNWGEAIIEAISATRVMVLVFSSRANDSPQVLREVERAVHRGLTIIPFRIEPVEPSRGMEYYLSAPHWLDAFTGPAQQHIDRLVQTVRRTLGLSETTATTPPVEALAAPSRMRQSPSTEPSGLPNRRRRDVLLVLGALAGVFIASFSAATWLRSRQPAVLPGTHSSTAAVPRESTSVSESASPTDTAASLPQRAPLAAGPADSVKRGTRRPAGYMVAFASLLSEQSARAIAEGIRIDDKRPFVRRARGTDGSTIFRVEYGPYRSEEDADRAGRRSGQPFWVYERQP